MTPRQLLEVTVRPGLAWLGPGYGSREAEVMLLAIAQQESRIGARRQVPTGPARSWWQAEPQTVAAVLAKWDWGRQRLKGLGLLNAVGLPAGPHDLATIVELSELAACIVARGLLWLDPAPLPALGDRDAAWTCYAERTWRPGRPRPETWPACYAAALAATAG